MSQSDTNTIRQGTPKNQMTEVPSKKSTFVLLGIAGGLLVFIAGVSVGGIEWWFLTQSRKAPSNFAAPASTPLRSPQTSPPAGGALAELNQVLADDSPGSRQPLSEALALAENTYPKDYKFPYEHAKLAVTGNVHHHAFGLLFLAGERAIDSGKADQLLSDLEKHKNMEFDRCSKGHEEWDVLLKALKTKDKSLLAMANRHSDIIGGADDMVMKY